MTRGAAKNRRMSRTARWLTVVVATTATAVVPANRAEALVIGHELSVGPENTAAGNITGVQSQRFDRNIDAQNYQCTNSDSVPWVVQDAWIYFTDDYMNWIELGTIHKQTGCKFWFWEEGSPNYYGGSRFHSLQPIYGYVGYAEHVFKAIRDGGATGWEFYVDSTLVAHPPIFLPPWIGRQAVAGLETTNLSTTVAVNGYYNLQYNQGGPWYNFGGNDTLLPGPHLPNPGPDMCGAWTNATHWRAALNSPC